MICLHCGKPIDRSASLEEIQGSWHKKCVKSFFGTDVLPEIDISEETIKRIADESTGRGYTVPGVQKKLSLHLTAQDIPRLTLVNYPTGYILKPQTEEYKAMPESEYLVMSMAKATGIETVPFRLMKVSGGYAYITKRIDRIFPKSKKAGMKKLAMEDFCQLAGRLTEHKYQGSYERCGKIVKNYSSMPGLDKAELFLRIVFSYITGNSDMHLKNFSLVETGEGSGQYRLSRAYDLLPVKVILPSDPDDMALTINGKTRNIRKKDFYILADSMELDKKVAERMIDKVVSMREQYIFMIEQSFQPADMKETFIQMIKERTDIFTK